LSPSESAFFTVMEYLGAPVPSLPMTEMTEVPGAAGGRKSITNLAPPPPPTQRRSVTGYDADYECRSKFLILFIYMCVRCLSCLLHMVKCT